MRAERQAEAGSGGPLADGPETPLRVSVFGRWRITDRSGTEIVLADHRRAVLAVLVAAAEPISRPELARSAGIKLVSLNPLLSRLPAALALPGPVHRAAADRKKHVELNHAMVSSDLADARRILAAADLDLPGAEELVALGVRKPLSNCGLPWTGPKADEIRATVDRVRVEALRRLARLDLATPDSVDPVIADAEPSPGDPIEVWLAWLDRVARARGRPAALARLADLDDLPALDTGSYTIAGPVAARAVIATAPGPAAGGGPPDPTARHEEITERIAGRLGPAQRARVVLVEWPDLDRTGLAGVATALRTRFPALVHTWAEGAPAAAVLAGLIAGHVGDRLRRPRPDLPERLIRSLVAIADRRPLEPASSHRDLNRMVADLYAASAPGASRLVVIGRHPPAVPDQDLMLADLLHLDEQLRLLVVASRDGAPGEALTAFETTTLAVVPGGGARPSRRPRLPAPMVAPQGPAVDGRVRRLVAMAADGDGRLLLPLARHLLALTDTGSDLDGGNVDIEPIRLAADTGRADVVTLASDWQADGYPSLSATERARAAISGLRWLIDAGLGSDLERTIALRLAAHVPPGSEAVDLVSSLRAAAAVTSSYGSHRSAVDLLDLAVQLPVAPGSLAELLGLRASSHRELGSWQQALADCRRAVELIRHDPAQIDALVDLALAMARLTWDPAVGHEVDRLLHDVRRLLPDDRLVATARIVLCLAGGSFQDGRSGAERVSPAVIRAALGTIAREPDPAARAWGFVHGRKALLGVLSVSDSARLAEKIVRTAPADPALAAHAYQAIYVDRIREGRWADARRALDEVERRARTTYSVEQRFSAQVARTCWDLAVGDRAGAEAGVEAELSFGPQLGGSTFDQVTMAHLAWLTRLRRDRTELGTMADAAADLARREPGGEIWSAGAALLSLECDRVADAVDLIRGIAIDASGGGRAPGPHRPAVLSITALVAAVSANAGRPGLDRAELDDLIAELEAVDAAVALIGWPTAVLGPVDRFRALAQAAAGRRAAARSAIDRACQLDEPLAAVHAETVAARSLVSDLC